MIDQTSLKVIPLQCFTRTEIVELYRTVKVAGCLVAFKAPKSMQKTQNLDAIWTPSSTVNYSFSFLSWRGFWKSSFFTFHLSFGYGYGLHLPLRNSPYRPQPINSTPGEFHPFLRPQLPLGRHRHGAFWPRGEDLRPRDFGGARSSGGGSPRVEEGGWDI